MIYSVDFCISGIIIEENGRVEGILKVIKSVNSILKSRTNVFIFVRGHIRAQILQHDMEISYVYYYTDNERKCVLDKKNYSK